MKVIAFMVLSLVTVGAQAAGTWSCKFEAEGISEIKGTYNSLGYSVASVLAEGSEIKDIAANNNMIVTGESMVLEVFDKNYTSRVVSIRAQVASNNGLSSSVGEVKVQDPEWFASGIASSYDVDGNILRNYPVYCEGTY
ncbi:MAG: hypothetical protein IT287_04615 [Bdellovibrionaceae bacterium]|nr:hypothetical protein [Pseudobdellovibrionaceae bacterium]